MWRVPAYIAERCVGVLTELITVLGRPVVMVCWIWNGVYHAVVVPSG